MILWGAAKHLRETLNVILEPSREEAYTSLIPKTREQIGVELFEEALKKGKAMKLEEAIDFALHQDHPG